MGFADKENKRKSVVGSLIGMNEQIEGQENIETLEDEKYMPEIKKDTSETKEKIDNPKKPKKIQAADEELKRYSFLLNPEIMEQLEKIARMKKYKYTSELIRDLFENEVNGNAELIKKYDKL